MSSKRKQEERSEGPGWLATLAGAALLIVAGFGVGLVAGTAFEEPDLVMEHLIGNTTDVPLAAPADADPPEGAYELASDPPSPAPVAAAPPPRAIGDGGFAIQVGAFSSDAAAQGLARKLTGLGMPTYVVNEPGGARFKVRVGPLETREAATQLARRLKADHRLPTWVLSREP